LYKWLLAFLAVILLPARAWADAPSLEGKWKQGPLREEYQVQQWLNGCGPAPVTGTTGGGEIVSIRVEGDELSIIGGGRVFKSNQCYDQLPTLVRDAHTRNPNGREWRTRCATPPSDPRRATMNTLVTASSDTHIDIIETGRYDITLNDGKCMADVKRARSYDLISKDGVPTTTATATTPPAPTTPTPRGPCSPGEPARLEVRPSRKLMRPGETFAFRAVVTDAKGCPTGTSTSWALASPEEKHFTLDPGGTVTVPADATDGTGDIVVSAANKSVKVTVEVAGAATYDDLLTKQGLNAAGESDVAATAVIAGSSIGGGEVKAEDGARRRRMIFIAIVAGSALVLGVLALVFSRRAKRAKVLEEELDDRHAERVAEVLARKRAKADAHAAQLRAHEESVTRAKQAARAAVGTMFCPTCRREYPPPAGNFCPQDATRLVELIDADPIGAPMGGVCPVCKRGFEPGVKVCPTDKEELVPFSTVAALPTVSVKGKICPTCGDRFDGSATFCGKDGTALVLLN
jgi:hypothetical protein